MVRRQSSKSWSIWLWGNGFPPQLVWRFLPISSPKLPKGVFSMDDSGRFSAIPLTIEIPDCHVARSGKRSFDFEQLITTKQRQQTNRLQNGPTLRTTQTLMPLWISLFQILCCLLWETWKKWSQTRFLFMAASQAFGISPWWNNPRVYNCWTPNKYSKPPWISWGPLIRLVIRKLPKEAGS